MQNDNSATQVRDKSSQQRVIEYTPLVSLHEGERRGVNVATSKPTYKVKEEEQHIWCRAFVTFLIPIRCSRQIQRVKNEGKKGEGVQKVKE